MASETVTQADRDIEEAIYRACERGTGKPGALVSAYRCAAVAELVEALERIINLSDSAMADGDGARDIAQQALSRHQAGLGKGDDQ